MMCKQIMTKKFLNEPEFLLLHQVKCFQVLASNRKNLIVVICLHTSNYIYIYVLKVNSLSVVLFLNELRLICLHTRIAYFSTH